MTELVAVRRLDIRVDGRLLFVQDVEEDSFSCEVSGTTLSLAAQVVDSDEPTDTPREG
jgi:hypothetical protein